MLTFWRFTFTASRSHCTHSNYSVLAAANRITRISLHNMANAQTLSVSKPLLGDNPCWGSTTQCDLQYLLSLISKKDVIVYESESYVVLNKPPDLRMDGPYPATVHKLLTYWYPIKSLLEQVSRHTDSTHNDSRDPHSSRDLATSTLLFKQIEQLHTHNALADNELRPCHQLDYATSGLLCVARTQLAAAHAIQQWEDRAVHKEYLAMLTGHLEISGRKPQHGNYPITSWDFSTMPKLPLSQIQSAIKSLELEYKRSRRKPRKETFQGFQPAHALFQKFKATRLANDSYDNATSSLLANENDIHSNRHPIKKKRKQFSILSDDQWDTIWAPVVNLLAHDSDNSCRNMWKTMEWKELCKTNPAWKRAFQQATDIHNDLLRTTLQGETETDHPLALPTVFAEEENSEVKSLDSQSQSFYIYCPIGQASNEFAMRIPPNEALTDKHPSLQPFVGSPDLDYKPGLTKCTILQSGVVNREDNGKNQVLTKVLLQPLTGRRHQLRVHMAILGHAIWGDATYQIKNGESEGKTMSETAPFNSRKTCRVTSSRMCLHSHKLSLRLLTKPNKGEDELVHLVAPDPFTIDSGTWEFELTGGCAAVGNNIKVSR